MIKCVGYAPAPSLIGTVNQLILRLLQVVLLSIKMLLKGFLFWLVQCNEHSFQPR